MAGHHRFTRDDAIAGQERGVCTLFVVRAQPAHRLRRSTTPPTATNTPAAAGEEVKKRGPLTGLPPRLRPASRTQGAQLSWPVQGLSARGTGRESCPPRWRCAQRRLSTRTPSSLSALGCACSSCQSRAQERRPSLPLCAFFYPQTLREAARVAATCATSVRACAGGVQRHL